jgi:membrane-bound serine protease (ClpP class)
VNEGDYLTWGLALLGVSLLLMAVEVFVPSAGIIALFAAGAAVGGLVLLFLYDPTWGIIATLGMLLITPVAIWLAVKAFPHTPIGKRLILGSGQDDTSKFEAAQAARDEQIALIGLEGEALTDLRPVGSARIDGKRVDVLAEGPMIEAGSRVRIVSAEGTQIKVRRIEA